MKCHKKYEIIDNDIFKIVPHLTNDLRLSITKWDQLYKKQLEDDSYITDEKKYIKNYFRDEYRQINECKKITKDLVYLEIGCGPMFFAQQISSKVKLVIGMDFSPAALKIAQKMFIEKGIKNYLFIQGDILNMPLKDDTVDLIYGCGVIEHFKNTQRCINELYRVLKKQGVSYNTVPYLNLGTLTYRQIWGNIPNLPILKQVAEFIHIKLLKEKYMVYGYEYSFLARTLRKIHRLAGFKKIRIEKVETLLLFTYIPSKLLKRICTYIATNNRLFWPAIKVIGQK